MIKIENFDGLPVGTPFYRKNKKDGKLTKYIPFFEKFNKVEKCIWADLEPYKEYYKDINENFSARLSFRNKIQDVKVTYWKYIKDKKKALKIFYSKKPEWEKKYPSNVWLWIINKKTGKCFEIYNPSYQTPEKVKRFYEFLDNFYNDEEEDL